MRKDFKYVEDSGGHGNEINERIGLCINCAHLPECTFCGSTDKPKLFCEEFECLGASCTESAVDIAVMSAESSTPAYEAVASKQGVKKYLGLCVNCENRESCCHTVTVGGIWFCEEYR